MAIDTIGGREYYTNAVTLALTASYVDVPSNTKALLLLNTDAHEWKFPSGVEVTMTGVANQVVNIVPEQIKRSSSTGNVVLLF